MATGTTRKVQVAYAPASGGEYVDGLRLATLTYPSGRELNLDYGTAGGLNDKLSRLASLKDNDGTTVLASYSYNGLARLVVEDFEQPDVKLDYYGGTAGTYAGFDRFGRVKTQLWRQKGDRLLFCRQVGSWH